MQIRYIVGSTDMDLEYVYLELQEVPNQTGQITLSLSLARSTGPDLRRLQRTTQCTRGHGPSAFVLLITTHVYLNCLKAAL